jgi:hypothetical protein
VKQRPLYVIGKRTGFDRAIPSASSGPEAARELRA